MSPDSAAKIKSLKEAIARAIVDKQLAELERDMASLKQAAVEARKAPVNEAPTTSAPELVVLKVVHGIIDLQRGP